MAVQLKRDSASDLRRNGAWRPTALCLLLIFAGFTLTSTTYLAWLYNLMTFPEASSIEAITMVGGYSFQALGLGIMALFARRWPETFARVPFISIVALHFLCAAPAMMGESFIGSLAFGFLMNVLCGAIAANYLHRLAADVRKGWRGTVFGGAYACSTLVSWLLSLIPALQPANGPMILVPCILLSALTAAVGLAPFRIARHVSSAATTAPGNPINGTAVLAARQTWSDTRHVELRSLIPFACLAVLLMSLVNNIGFAFPAADIAAGVNLELSRLFYAVGLVAAGIVIDRSFRHGMICCVIALVMPFAFMVLANEPIPATIVWGLGYLFSAFFSVFRVTLFANIASEHQLLHVAYIGLMMGRIGDALGTAVYLTLGSNAIALVAVTIVLFATSVFVVYRLGQFVLAENAALPAKTGQELLAEFGARYGLSAREKDVLALLMEGRSNAEIAAELFVSESTVKFHVHNLLKKTECRSRNELRGAVIGKNA